MSAPLAFASAWRRLDRLAEAQDYWTRHFREDQGCAVTSEVDLEQECVRLRLTHPRWPGSVWTARVSECEDGWHVDVSEETG